MHHWRAAALAGMITLIAAHAGDTPGLSNANFVELGDVVTEVLDTSGLALSTLWIDALARGDARPELASLPSSAAAAPREQSFQRACPGGGSLRASLLDADRSGELSSGDRFVSVFENCTIEGRVVTGRTEFVVAAHRIEGGVEVTELAFRFKDFGTAQMRWTGPARAVLRSDLRLGDERYSVTYQGLAVTSGARSMRWNFGLELIRPPIGTQLASINGALGVGELHLQLRQDDPYQLGSDGIARAGQATLSDPHGARLQVAAGRRRFAYRLYIAGNHGEVPDATSQSAAHGQR